MRIILRKVFPGHFWVRMATTECLGYTGINLNNSTEDEASGSRSGHT